MKRNFERFITISLSVVSLIFVVFAMILIFNTDIAEEANNGVVQSLFGIFALFFVILTTLNILGSFSETDRVNQILLFKTKDSVRKASVSVIRKLAKQAVLNVEGAKVKHIHLFTDATNEVIMKASVKVASKKDEPCVKATQVLEQVNAALVSKFLDELSFEFKEIELKLTSIKNNKKQDTKTETTPKQHNSNPQHDTQQATPKHHTEPTPKPQHTPTHTTPVEEPAITQETTIQETTTPAHTTPAIEHTEHIEPTTYTDNNEIEPTETENE
ncbi:MAG: hypothetical protein FWB72_05685 [Firmicutes bacterium]|nr:hypothetical protein [Bacillota bacterium]